MPNGWPSEYSFQGKPLSVNVMGFTYQWLLKLYLCIGFPGSILRREIPTEFNLIVVVERRGSRLLGECFVFLFLGSRLLHPLFRLVEPVIEMAMEWEPVSDAFLPFSLKV